MSDFGGTLRLARERRGISLRQISVRTKIPAAALEALERNDLSRLPGGIFSRAFVRAYAIEVGLDPDRTVEAFLDTFEAAPAAPAAPAMPRGIPDEESSFESQQRIVRVAMLLAAISVPLVGLVLYATARGARPHAAPPAERSENAAPPPVTEAPVVEVRSSSAVVRAADAADADTIRVELHPRADCWVRTIVDGHPGRSTVLHGGERRLIEARESLVLDVGDAGVCAYSINGRPGRPLGAAGEARTARITRQTLAQYTQ